MIEALYVGSTGMYAQQTNLETVANNLANMNTPGYKRAQVVFEDLIYREGLLQNPTQGEGDKSLQLGMGARVSSVDKVFTQGELRETGSPLDLAINGDGFVEVQRLDGRPAYSRAGSLRVNSEGLLSLANGLPLNPPITIPAEAKELSVSRDGTVTVITSADSQPTEVGRIDLVMFNSPASLKPIGENIYEATDIAGSPMSGRPGEEGRGVIAQKFLEGSNVRMTDELVNLMLAQRAFEANSKIIQAADEMLSISNNLRRS